MLHLKSGLEGGLFIISAYLGNAYATIYNNSDTPVDILYGYEKTAAPCFGLNVHSTGVLQPGQTASTSGAPSDGDVAFCEADTYVAGGTPCGNNTGFTVLCYTPAGGNLRFEKIAGQYTCVCDPVDP